MQRTTHKIGKTKVYVQGEQDAGIIAWHAQIFDFAHAHAMEALLKQDQSNASPMAALKLLLHVGAHGGGWEEVSGSSQCLPARKEVTTR